MPVEYALTQIDARVVRLSDTPVNLTVQPRTWWPLAEVVLAGLVFLYLVEIIQDIQRVRDLRAEPSSLSRIIVITKNEAWQRIRGRPAPFATSGLRGTAVTRDARKP